LRRDKTGLDLKSPGSAREGRKRKKITTMGLACQLGVSTIGGKKRGGSMGNKAGPGQKVNPSGVEKKTRGCRGSDGKECAGSSNFQRGSL